MWMVLLCDNASNYWHTFKNGPASAFFSTYESAVARALDHKRNYRTTRYIVVEINGEAKERPTPDFIISSFDDK